MGRHQKLPKGRRAKKIRVDGKVVKRRATKRGAK